MKILACVARGLGLILLLVTPAGAVDVDGSWAVCFPSPGAPFCGQFDGSMTAVHNAFTITVESGFCTISGTVNATTGAITVPPGQCVGLGLTAFTGSATDTVLTADADFALCPTYHLTAVKACGACDDGDQCTVDGCGATACSAPASSCTSAFVPVGTPCDDGDACTVNDICGDAGVPAVCGGHLMPCSDGNPCTDDSCDGTGGCIFTPNSDPCDDGTACTTGDTCSGGTCVGGPATQCGPCETCFPLAGCLVGPKSGCLQSNGKAKLALKDSPVDAKDKLKWSWGRGQATTTAQLGNPVATDDYTLCIFDGPPLMRRLFLDSTASAGGSCVDGGSCWKPRGTPPGAKGFIYKDSKILLPDGLKRVKLQPGPDGKAKASVAGQGANLELPSPMNVALPVVVQLQAENGTCFESVFTTAKQNVEDSFKATTSPSGAFIDDPP